MSPKRKQRYLYIDGKAIPVTAKVYHAFWHYEEVIAKVDPNRCDRKKAVKERGDSEKSEWGSRPHGKRREGGISE